MQIYAINSQPKCFFSFISRPILIVIALFGRAELRTLNFYTEFWNFAPLINYGNLCKFIPKITKIASSPSHSWPIFIGCLYLSDRARWVLQIPVHKIFDNSINYANLCKFIVMNIGAEIKSQKMRSSPSFLTDFDLVCFIW